MANSIHRNLQNLKSRRTGTGSTGTSFNVQLDELIANAQRRTESYERRSGSAATQYALGAMQRVDPEYTKNSYVEGDRIKNQLLARLAPEYRAAFEYQGSVPLDVHIKGVSDIDLLVLRTDFVTVDPNGPKTYFNVGGETPATCLSRLRADAARHIGAAFPEVNVDTSGAKCLTLSGGSLRRNVDVIPCHWHDTSTWQYSGDRKDRGVKILDAKEGATILNMPFLHIDKIHQKDLLCAGGVKKVIRLLKNVSADADIADAKRLSSYDIAGLVWHFPDNELSVQVWNELALVAVAQSNLERLLANPSIALNLRTPDGSRCILDDTKKFSCLEVLQSELNDLAEQIVSELGAVTFGERARILKTLRDSYMPEAA